jgi:glycosyl transferase family 25
MLNTSFDQVYVINLPERADRRREMDEQLGQLGMSLSSPKVHLFKAVRPDSEGGFSSRGARGCFLSHLGILEHAADSGFKKILILEDDCNFGKVLSTQAEAFAKIATQGDWAILYGGPVDKTPNSNAELVSEKLAPETGVTGTHFVALDQVAIATAVPYLNAMLRRPAGDPNGGPMHVDGAYSWLRHQNADLITLTCIPQIAYQRSSRTDIHTGQWYDRYPVTSTLVSIARKFKNFIQKG